ncbi:MAG: 3-oxoacyl-ACP reductase FabG [Alphaproteobacteria bacterium]|nr:MAG: 3-oxoacyl-ACP reductase FabG [Alphaproteobacteria bacterium]
MFDLKGKRALVTGATGNIGSAIARTLHNQGAHVVISGTRDEKLDTLARELGSRTTVISCDLSDRSAVTALIPSAIEAMSGLDIVVNNAGITRDMLAMRMKDEDWDTVINVNLSAAFVISREAIKTLMRNRWGRIINIASIVGVMGNPGQANYCASKAGLIGMTKALAQEVAVRGVTLNCVAPGFIESDMTAKLNDTQKGAIMGKIPAGSIGSPDDVAAAVAFLASNEAKYITGQTLHINGGMAMV